MGRPAISTPEEDKEICQMYPESKTKDIVVAFNYKFSPKQIRQIAERYNVRKSGREMLRHVEDTERELKLSDDDIKNKRCRPGGQPNQAGTTLINNYFEKIDTSEKAYWLGFLYADGYVYDRKGFSYRLELGLAARDLGHLHKFRYCIGSNKKITTKPVKCRGKEYMSKKITIYGEEFISNLINKGVVPRKSLILTYPDRSILPEKFDNAFIRGYFDGDGCVYGKHEDYSYDVNFVGTKAFLEKVNEILHSKLGLSIVSPQKKGRAFSIHFGGYENLVRLYEYMYKDSTVSLDRKRTHFQGIINTKKYVRASQTN